MPKTKAEGGEKKKPQARRPPTQRGEWFVGVAQCRFENQMSVIEYIMTNPYFKAVKIVHTRDYYTADDFVKVKKQNEDGEEEESEKNEEGQTVHQDASGKPYIEIAMPDGSKLRKYEGDKKEDHVHILVKVPKRQTAAGFNKEFCGIVKFQVCQSPEGSFRYFLHSDFKSTQYKKAAYGINEITGEQSLIDQLQAVAFGQSDLFALVQLWTRYVQANFGDVQQALQNAVLEGQRDLIQAIASHGYFFKAYFAYDNHN